MPDKASVESVIKWRHLTFSIFKESLMPIIAWLLGVPLSIVLLLMLFGVF